MNERLLIKVVAVKLDMDTYERLKKAAALDNMTMAGFLRDRIETAVKLKTDPPLAPPRLEPWRSMA